MTCDQLDSLPFPACAQTIVLPEATGPTAPPHVARIRNLATDRRERVPATVDGGGTVTVTLPRPLQAGHEYLLELLDVGTDERHQLTLCGSSAYAVRLRPVQEFDGDGEPVQQSTVVLACAS